MVKIHATYDIWFEVQFINRCQTVTATKFGGGVFNFPLNRAESIEHSSTDASWSMYPFSFLPLMRTCKVSINAIKWKPNKNAGSHIARQHPCGNYSNDNSCDVSVWYASLNHCEQRRQKSYFILCWPLYLFCSVLVGCDSVQRRVWNASGCHELLGQTPLNLYEYGINCFSYSPW